MNQFISVFDHIFDVSVVQNPQGLIETIVHFLYYSLVTLKKAFIQQTQYLYSFERHLQDDLYLQPKVADALRIILLVACLIFKEHPV